LFEAYSNAAALQTMAESDGFQVGTHKNTTRIRLNLPSVATNCTYRLPPRAAWLACGSWTRTTRSGVRCATRR
jgi:hypothetical protein